MPQDKPRKPTTTRTIVRRTTTRHPLRRPAPSPSRPVTHPTPRSPTPAPPAPADLQRLVEDACRFILQKKESHAAGIAWEVGQYLFEKTFRGNLDYLQSKNQRKPDSLAEIARRTGIHRIRLASWIRAYVAQKYLAPTGIDPDLSPTEFETLRPLIDHPEAARAVLDLRRRHNLSTQQLDTLAVAWKRRLDEGGRLEDLLKKPLPPNIRPRRRRDHRNRPPKRPDLTIPRLVGLVLRWLDTAPLAPHLRAEIDDRLRSLRNRLAAAGDTTSSPTPPPPRPAPRRTPAPPSAPSAPPPDPEPLVAAAVAFIEQRLRSHTLEFALEVGRYLFEHVYDGDRALFHYGGHPWQTDTIRRIAQDPRVALGVRFLYSAIHIYLLQDRAARALPAGRQLPQLPASAWNALWPLDDQPDTLLPVARWAEAGAVPVRTIADVAAVVAPYLEHGGRLDDLLVATPRAKSPETPYRRIRRILDVLDSLLDRHPPEPPVRARTLALLPPH